jgi:hypothetical protein
LKPLLERASTKPVIPAKAGTQPIKKTRRKPKGADEDAQLEAFNADTPDHDPGHDLIAAK